MIGYRRVGSCSPFGTPSQLRGQIVRLGGQMPQLGGQIARLGGQSIAYVRKKQYLCTGFEKAPKNSQYWYHTPHPEGRMRIVLLSRFCRAFTELLPSFCRAFTELLPSFCRAFTEFLPSFLMSDYTPTSTRRDGIPCRLSREPRTERRQGMPSLHVG